MHIEEFCPIFFLGFEIQSLRGVLFFIFWLEFSFFQVSSALDLPATNPEHKPEKIENGKGLSSFECELYDVELVRKIAQAFLPGIATACVDNTSGDVFKTPASVAAGLRQEMVEYVTKRSESFVAETVVVEGGPEGSAIDHPYDVISDFVEQFAQSKMNLFSRVSGWMLSEKREDKIDDLVQEMEVNRFWLMDKREAIAQSLVTNIDYTNMYHCNMRFDSEEELAEHAESCSFRSTTCKSEGCNALFSKRNAERHDSICPFKMIPCEQMCSDSVMRRAMDRHCVTVCPMRLVSCPFYAVGCLSALPHCKLEQHHSNSLDFHLLSVLRSIHKESSQEDLQQRADQLQNVSIEDEFMQIVRSHKFGREVLVS